MRLFNLAFFKFCLILEEVHATPTRRVGEHFYEVVLKNLNF